MLQNAVLAVALGSMAIYLECPFVISCGGCALFHLFSSGVTDVAGRLSKKTSKPSFCSFVHYNIMSDRAQNPVINP